MSRVLLGVVFALVLAPLVLLGWLRWGHPPVAVDDPPLPLEHWITSVPKHARIDREMVDTPPIQANEDNLVAGARVYAQQCAACHGLHAKPSSFGQHMFPKAPPLWEQHANSSVVGVSDDPPGETYWKVANGIRLSGMPSYKSFLTETQMWQVSLLLANADKPLPPAAVMILRGQELPQPAPAPTTPAARP